MGICGSVEKLHIEEDQVVDIVTNYATTGSIKLLEMINNKTQYDAKSRDRMKDLMKYCIQKTKHTVQNH
jgi:hypothetical protein